MAFCPYGDLESINESKTALLGLLNLGVVVVHVCVWAIACVFAAVFAAGMFACVAF